MSKLLLVITAFMLVIGLGACAPSQDFTEEIEDSIVFHAGTKQEEGEIVTNGGRVIALTSFGNDYKKALKKSYQSAEKLQFDKMYFRKDIGFDLS